MPGLRDPAYDGLRDPAYEGLRDPAYEIGLPRNYAALVTFPDRRHRVQTRSRRIPPLTIARTR